MEISVSPTDFNAFVADEVSKAGGLAEVAFAASAVGPVLVEAGTSFAIKGVFTTVFAE